MMAVLLSTLPIIIFFILYQRYFINGLGGSLKESSRRGSSGSGEIVTTVPVCLVGCGGMRRHVQGFAARCSAQASAMYRLVAVCDVRRMMPSRVAGEAEEAARLPAKITSPIDDAVADPEIAAFDVVTEAFGHPRWCCRPCAPASMCCARSRWR